MLTEAQSDEIELLKGWMLERSKTWPNIESWKTSDGYLLKDGGQQESFFSNNFIVPALLEYFLDHSFLKRHGLTELDARQGLAIEKSQHSAPGITSPQRKRPHLLLKSEAFTKTPPKCWFDTSLKPTDRYPSPDFIVRKPLPFNLVGELC